MSASLYQQRTGTGPAVVLVHGIADDSSIWAGTVAALSADCACTAIDLPGHGRSPTPTEPSAYEREALLASIDEVLDGTGPAVYVGHSLGGYLGLAHSITRPGVLRGLVLVATGPGFRDAAAMADWNDRVHLSAPSSRRTPASPPRPACTPDSMVIDRLAEVSVPVGLLVGSQDKAFFGANDYMERKLPDVRRRTIAAGRHRLMRTHAADVEDMVREVLAATDLAPGR